MARPKSLPMPSPSSGTCFVAAAVPVTAPGTGPAGSVARTEMRVSSNLTDGTRWIWFGRRNTVSVNSARCSDRLCCVRSRTAAPRSPGSLAGPAPDHWRRGERSSSAVRPKVRALPRPKLWRARTSRPMVWNASSARPAVPVPSARRLRRSSQPNCNRPSSRQAWGRSRSVPKVATERRAQSWSSGVEAVLRSIPAAAGDSPPGSPAMRSRSCRSTNHSWPAAGRQPT